MGIFNLQICTDNAAFEDSSETPRILRELADRIEADFREDSFILRDVNGNTVGIAESTEED